MKRFSLLTGILLQLSLLLAAGNPVFGTTNSDGSFSHSIPLELPAGVNGAAPNLSLEYNSGSGNGILGIGMALHGIPTVTRMDSGNGINYRFKSVASVPEQLNVAASAGEYQAKDTITTDSRIDGEGKTLILEAGRKITFTSGFKITKGNYLTARLNRELPQQPDRESTDSFISPGAIDSATGRSTQRLVWRTGYPGSLLFQQSRLFRTGQNLFLEIDHKRWSNALFWKHPRFKN